MLAVFVLLICGAIAGAGIWVVGVADSAPSVADLEPVQDAGESSEIFDADGNRLGFIKADTVRESVPLDKIPEVLREATISIEDEHFYTHSGVDYAAIVRAFYENTTSGEIKQGASTITQQLVRNLYIRNPQDTAERKIVEIKMAMDYEELHSKDEILEKYLNTATYGTNSGQTAVGVEAAAQTYFSKPVDRLNLNEAATIAGLPQAPSLYNPMLNEQAAIDRRDDVLDAMVDQGYITAEQAAETKAKEIPLKPGDRYSEVSEQYVFNYVQQELIERYGYDAVRKGGLKVYTTIEPELQEAARAAIAAHPVYGDSTASSAMVSTDVQTGQIKAMASSATYDQSQFDLAAQGRRQPGSAFKPFVLATAIKQGIDPDTTTYPAPGTITIDMGEGADPWVVNGGGGGSLNLRTALPESINTVFAQLSVDVGAENTVETAHSLGITSDIDPVPAIALGGLTYGVSPLEMSNAYATFADGGVHHPATAIDRVVFPDGEVDEPAAEEGERVLLDGEAYLMADIMKGVFLFGTAVGHGIRSPDGSLCVGQSGKTGTTEEMADAWFVGYTPKISTAVWVGHKDTRYPLPGYGADMAAPIWDDYMAVATKGECEDFPEAKNLPELSQFKSELTVKYDKELEVCAADVASGDEPLEVDTDGDGEVDCTYTPPEDDEDKDKDADEGEDPGNDDGAAPPADNGNSNGGGPPAGGGGPPSGGFGT